MKAVVGLSNCSAQDYCRTFYQISDHTIRKKEKEKEKGSDSN